MGTALVVERPASPGMLGLAGDFLRLTGGEWGPCGCPCADASWLPCWPGMPAAERGNHAAPAAGYSPPALAPLNPARLRPSRRAAGMRVLPLLCMSSFMPLPPLAALLTHLALAALTWNPGAFCSTRLLQDSLSQRRLGIAARVLEYAAMPLAAVQPHLAAGRGVPSPAIAAAGAPVVRSSSPRQWPGQQGVG